MDNKLLSNYERQEYIYINWYFKVINIPTPVFRYNFKCDIKRKIILRIVSMAGNSTVLNGSISKIPYPTLSSFIYTGHINCQA